LANEPAMSEKITLAHVSDVHLSPFTGLAWRHMNVKRGLGYFNYRRQRKRTHHRTALDLVIADMKAHAPDHIAVTGDLINLGLPAEYEAATHWLHDLGKPDHVTVVPGNHDIYTSLGDDIGVARWADYMRSDAFGHAHAAAASGAFPFVRRIGPVALIGVNSAIETPLFIAAGEVGDAQLAAVDELLAKLHDEGLIRVVLIHHPPLPGQAPPRRALRDADALSRILARRGAELVLHGHNHRDSHMDFARLPEVGGGSVPVVGVASGSAIRVHKHEPLGRYNLLRISRSEGRAHIDCITRGIDASGTAVVQVARKQLS
jgi:3',5'-cyclic AMP phosphodiesterase CpdA